MVATGETMGLAEWIIDDTCLVETAFKKLPYYLLNMSSFAFYS